MMPGGYNKGVVSSKMQPRALPLKKLPGIGPEQGFKLDNKGSKAPRSLNDLRRREQPVSHLLRQPHSSN